MTLLANFYRDHDEMIGEFIDSAVSANTDRPYLLDMLKYILPGTTVQIVVFNR